MTYEKSLEVGRELFDEYSKGIKNEDIEWLRQRIIEAHPAWKEFKDKSQFEYYVLDELNRFLYAIQYRKPENLRTFAEEELKKQEYDQRLSEIAKQITALEPGDERACDVLRENLYKLLDKAEREFPGFKKGRAMMISELRGNILAVKTKGRMGSRAMISQMSKKKKKSE